MYEFFACAYSLLTIDHNVDIVTVAIREFLHVQFGDRVSTKNCVDQETLLLRRPNGISLERRFQLKFVRDESFMNPRHVVSGCVEKILSHFDSNNCALSLWTPFVW